jgi:hypothetical protein
MPPVFGSEFGRLFATIHQQAPQDKHMQVALMPYERRVLESLESRFELERELTGGIALSLRDLREAFDRVLHDGASEFRQGRVAVVGFVNHAHHLLIGGFNALDQGNGPVWSACVRGLIETVGACFLVGEQPARAPNFLEDRVTAGKLRAAAERACPGLGKDLDRLNNIVHPASRAVFAGFRAVDVESRGALVQYGCEQAERAEGREGVIVLGNLAHELSTRLEELSKRSAVLNAGRIVMVRTGDLESSGD